MKYNGKLLIPIGFFLICVFILIGNSSAQTFDLIKGQVKEHTLANGMKFIVLERHDAPVVSFHTYADVGSVNESYGITGISHLLEHMAFKGTKLVGTKNYGEEEKLLDEMDRIYDQLTREQNVVNPDKNKIETLQAEFDKIKSKAHDLVVNNEYGDLFMKEGGQDFNAFTSNDATQYICSLPSNRLEFWMAMESDRFKNPIFREFFEERNVVMEERRLGVETQPMGKLFEDFISVAFKSHPYHHEVIGHMSDLKRITRKDVKEYFYKYYGPNNLTCVVVGDVNADEFFKMAEIYFGRIPGAPKPEPLRTEEPEQWGERHVIVEAQSQPMLIAGYHRPSVNSEDDLHFDAMANILGLGRSSRLYKGLVKEKKIAIEVYSFNGWPGDKYPNLFAVYVMPAKDHTVAECLKAIDEEIEKMKSEFVTDEELTKYKRQTKKQMINSMKSNFYMAYTLAYYDVVRGDWRKTFDIIKDIEIVTASDVQAVAQKYLIKKHRTVGEIVPERP